MSHYRSLDMDRDTKDSELTSSRREGENDQDHSARIGDSVDGFLRLQIARLALAAWTRRASDADDVFDVLVCNNRAEHPRSSNFVPPTLPRSVWSFRIESHFHSPSSCRKILLDAIQSRAFPEPRKAVEKSVREFLLRSHQTTSFSQLVLFHCHPEETCPSHIAMFGSMVVLRTFLGLLCEHLIRSEVWKSIVRYKTRIILPHVILMKSGTCPSGAPNPVVSLNEDLVSRIPSLAKMDVSLLPLVITDASEDISSSFSSSTTTSLLRRTLPGSLSLSPSTVECIGLWSGSLSDETLQHS